MNMFDFEDGNGPVAAHQHPNGGGWVADTASVDETAYVGPDARVYGNALVYGNAEVSENAQVFGNARVFGDAQVYGNAIVDRRITTINRSDGYTFMYVPCSDGQKRIIAGCRYFTMEEAIEHWTKTRGGTDLGEETMDILSFFEKRG